MVLLWVEGQQKPQQRRDRVEHKECCNGNSFILCQEGLRIYSQLFTNSQSSICCMPGMHLMHLFVAGIEDIVFFISQEAIIA